MFDGKMLRELAGTPMRRIDLANSPLALADPDPLTLANLTTKSLTAVIAGTAIFVSDAIVQRSSIEVVPAQAGTHASTAAWPRSGSRLAPGRQCRAPGLSRKYHATIIGGRGMRGRLG